MDKLRIADTAERAGFAHTTAAMIRACFQRPVAPGKVAAEDIAQMDRARVSRTIRQHLASPRLTLNRICQMTGLSRSSSTGCSNPMAGWRNTSSKSGSKG